jgi:hypothetical protein
LVALDTKRGTFRSQARAFRLSPTGHIAFLFEVHRQRIEIIWRDLSREAG